MIDKPSPPAATLSRQRILRSAIEQADAHGLEQLSMRKLAAELSVTPMALYWHFANRDALIDAMAEQILGELSYQDEPSAPWQERLRGVLTATLDVFREHPWLGPLARRRIVPAPNFLGTLEVLLDAVRAAGYGRTGAVRVVDFAIDSLAAVAAEFPATADPTPDSEGQLTMRKQLRELAGTDYPRIREAAVPLTTSASANAYVKLSLNVLVGGIEAAPPKHRRR
jgi:AcrR family transcriptional regulator